MPGEVNMKAVRRGNFAILSFTLSTSSAFRRWPQLFNGNEAIECIDFDPNAEGTCL